MLFSLSNLKRRSVRDPDGELAVVPKLLHGRTALRLVEQTLEVFEGYVGKPRSEYDPRTLEAVMSDYRLARCIEACLLTHYAFVQPQLDSLLSAEQMTALAERGLTSPSDMRLALWDAANSRYGGYVPPSERETLLATLAQEWDLPIDAMECSAILIDALLALDSDASAVLTSTRERPTARDIMRLYNQGAVKTLLAHSNNVKFEASRLPGAALKKAYFIAKRRGVLVEIEERVEGTGYSLTLYGPEQAFGTVDKYGQRLADVALSLLRSLLSMADFESGEVEATAHLTLHDRPYRFHLNGEILSRLGFAPEPAISGEVRRIAESSATYSVGAAIEVWDDTPAEEPTFDSMVEAALYREHKSLEKQGYTHGWLLQREPDPLLAPGVVIIPDFAFLRGDTRVFMEIAGFWSPTYKEKKLGKLRALAALEGDEAALIVAAPQDAAPIFAGLPYPIIPYKNNLRMTDVLAVLDARYGQREQRADAAQQQVQSLRETALSRGLVPETEVAQALQAYTRSELLSSARALDSDVCKYVAGVGLLSATVLQTAHDKLESALAESLDGKLNLEDAAGLVASVLGESVDVEALVQLWPDWNIDRPSLFEAYLFHSPE